MKQLFWAKSGKVLRQSLFRSLLSVLLLAALVSCTPGTDNPFDSLIDSLTGTTTQTTEETTQEISEGEISELVPSEESTSEPLIVEIVETPTDQLDQLEQALIASQEASESEGNVLEVVTLEDTSETAIDDATETSQDTARETSTDTSTDASAQKTSTSATATNSESEATTETASNSQTDTTVTTNSETTTNTETSVSSFTTTPPTNSGQSSEGNGEARAEDPDRIIIEYTNVDSIQNDASLSSFFATGPHVLLAMRDEDEMVGIATLAPDGTLSLRTADVLANSRPADQTFIGCLDVTRETPAGSAVYGGIAFFESVTVPGLILTPVLDINGDNSYIPAVNYVRLTDPLLVKGVCFEIENAIESIQASFVPGWNRLLRELDWRDIAQGNTEAQNPDIQKTLWSVNNNSETIVKWIYSRP